MTPPSALELEQTESAPVPNKKVGLMLACEYAPHGLPKTANESGLAPAGVTRCLHSMSSVWLFEQAQRTGASDWYFLAGQCTSCTRAPKATLDVRWQALANRFQLMGVPFPTLTWCSLPKWAQLTHALKGEEPNTGSKSKTLFKQIWPFFRSSAVRPAAPPLPANTPPMTSDRTAAVQLLKKARLQAQPQTDVKNAQEAMASLWTVRLNVSACHWCMACVRICPSAALYVTSSADGKRGLFGIDSDLCTGCGICADLCDTHALSIATTHDLDLGKATHPQRLFPLHQYTCVQCKIHFWSAHVQEALDSSLASSKPRSLVCMVCTQGKPQHHQRIIESVASSDASVASTPNTVQP